MTDSAVRATHLPSGITVTCRDERSQHRNKALAIERIANALLCVLADRWEEDAKSSLVVASKNLERGNAVNIFRL